MLPDKIWRAISSWHSTFHQQNNLCITSPVFLHDLIHISIHMKSRNHLKAWIGNLHNDVFLLLRQEFITVFISYLNLVIPVRFNLHKKAKPWRILVVVVKWCHHAKWPINGEIILLTIHLKRLYFSTVKCSEMKFKAVTNKECHLLIFSSAVTYLVQCSWWPLCLRILYVAFVLTPSTFIFSSDLTGECDRFLVNIDVGAHGLEVQMYQSWGHRSV